jgi:tRNA threonylcarbamoyl adenosine modification protein YeaZ
VILVVDSSGATAVAVVDETGARVIERVSDDPRGHAEAIGPLLAAALAAAPVVTAVAYGVGPGPFTGLRVGIAAARAAALALGVPELPVVSHDAIALAALEAGARAPFVVLTDAKRREQYFSVYTGLDDLGLPVRGAGPEVGPGSAVPPLPRVESPLSAPLLGRIAAVRFAAGRPPAPAEALYLRSPDVTLAARAAG